MTTATEKLGAFVAALDWDRVAAARRDKVKDHILDTLGVACAGRPDPQVSAVSGVVSRWGGIASAGIIGLDARLPAPKAAFLNALAARIHTFDDTHEAGPAHPGSAVVAAALAAAEQAGASGATLLAAALAGYEVATRVSAALGATHYAAGFHSTGTAAPFGAAAAAARALGLDAAQTAAALALAGEAAIGLRQYQEDGSLLDTALNAARGAELGVAAAELAAAGLAGPRGVLDGRWGLLRVMAGGAGAGLTDGLGTRWEFDDTVLKPFASCRFTHGPVMALLASGIDPSRVESVDIATFRTSCEVSDKPEPRSRAEAILSHQVAAALALSGRSPMPADFDALDDAVLALARRVRVVHDPALDVLYPASWPHRLTIRLDDGRVVRLAADRPPAADRAAAQTKFRALASSLLGADGADALASMVASLETTADLRPLAELLRPRLAEAA